MERNIFENFNQLVVSSELRQSGINQPAALDKRFNFEKGNILQVEPQFEIAEDEVTGYEEATDIDYRGDRIGGFNLSFPKAQIQHLQHILGFAYCGSYEFIGVGSDGTKSVLTPGDAIEPYLFSAMFQESELQKTLFASLAYENFDIVFEKEKFVKASAAVRGTGYNEKNWKREKVTTQSAVGSELLVSTNILNNDIKSVREILMKKNNGSWSKITASSVGEKTIRLSEQFSDGTGEREFQITYEPTGISWASTEISRIKETPLLTSSLSVIIGGKFDKTLLTISGGVELNREIRNLTYHYEQQLTIEARPCASGDNPYFANYMVRMPRKQTLTLERDAVNLLMQTYMELKENISFKIVCEGVEFEPGVKYSLVIIFPRVGITKSPRSVDNSMMKETVTLEILEDTAGLEKSVYAILVNKQEKVAALA